MRVKLGMDPTAPHVTLGWAVQLRKLRRFQDLGHTAVLIVGDFTARIGDPSGQKADRPMLSTEEVRGFAERVLEQFRLVLSEERLEVRYNSEWLEGLGVDGLLQLATHSTVAQMLQRDDFAIRFEAHTPISIKEFMYPLLQAYDSVAVRADVELGGTDQYYTLLLGREIQKVYGQTPQVVFTSPLIEGTDGVEKMSQSKGNYIGITEPSDEMFGKLMSIPDHLMPKYFRLTTDLDPAEVDRIEKDLASGALRPEVGKRRLAAEVVRLYHGEAAAEAARERFDRVFKERAFPEEVEERPIPDECMLDGSVLLARLLKELGFAESSSKGRRLIAQGAVKADGRPLTDERVPPGALRGKVLKAGRHFVRIV